MYFEVCSSFLARNLVICRSEQAAGEVIYPRGSISGIPEDHASRRDRFAELDDLQPGWQVELRGRKGGTTVDATFFSPEGWHCSCSFLKLPIAFL